MKKYAGVLPCVLNEEIRQFTVGRGLAPAEALNTAYIEKVPFLCYIQFDKSNLTMEVLL